MLREISIQQQKMNVKLSRKNHSSVQWMIAIKGVVVKRTKGTLMNHLFVFNEFIIVQQGKPPEKVSFSCLLMFGIMFSLPLYWFNRFEICYACCYKSSFVFDDFHHRKAECNKTPKDVHLKEPFLVLPNPLPPFWDINF